MRYLMDNWERLLQIAGGDVVAGNEGFLRLHNFIDTQVGVERGLYVTEDDDGAIGASSPIL